MKLYLVIPCYNESLRLNRAAFAAFAALHDDVHFLFVNDGSTDATLAMLQAMVIGHNNMSVLHLPQNGGKAEAVRQGMLHAGGFSPDYIGFWDADLATPLSELHGFIGMLHDGRFDAITGLRLMRLGAMVRRNAMRHYMGRLFATVASQILGVHAYDTQCGAKLYKAALVPELLHEKFVTRWFFDVEILARYIKRFGRAAAKTNIYEHPVGQWEDVGASRLKLKDFITVPVELWKIKRKYF